MIQFNTIPINLRTPGQYIEIDNSRAVQSLPGMPKRMLLVGTKVAGGTATNGDITTVTNVATARSLYGEGSQLHEMVVAVMDNNQYTDLRVISVSGASAVANALASVGDTWYTTLVLGMHDDAAVQAALAWADDKWAPMTMQDAHVFVCASGTHADVATYANNYNSQWLTILPQQGSTTPTHAIAAAFAAVDEAEPDPARQRTTLAVKGINAPTDADRYTATERNLHLHDGVSSWTVDDGGTVRVERLITTYKTNASGDDDVSYLDITTMRTIAYLRYSVRARIAVRYPRHKLADDGTSFGAGQAIVTPNIIRAELLALFRQWEQAGLVEGFAQFKQDLLVERDATDRNRVNAIIPPDIINQMRVFAASVQFRL